MEENFDAIESVQQFKPQDGDIYHLEDSNPFAFLVELKNDKETMPTGRGIMLKASRAGLGGEQPSEEKYFIFTSLSGPMNLAMATLQATGIISQHAMELINAVLETEVKIYEIKGKENPDPEEIKKATEMIDAADKKANDYAKLAEMVDNAIKAHQDAEKDETDEEEA